MAVFSALASELAITLVSAGLSSGVATIVADLIVGVGASLLASAFQKKPSQTTPKYQAVLNQSTAPRIRGYGRIKVSGPRAWWNRKDKYLHQVIALHTGKVSAIREVWFGDKAVTWGDDGYVRTEPFGGDWGSFARVRVRLGTADQTVYYELQDDFPGRWTDDHIGKGVASIYTVFEAPKAEGFPSVWPESYNTAVRAVIDATEVYDPRSGLTEWNDNAGLCIADYLAAEDGFPGVEFDDIDWNSVADFADLCGEMVDKKNGTAEKRYRLWGTYGLGDEPKSVLERMTKVCDGELYLTPQGKIGIRGGAWTEPTVTITDDMILGYDGFEQGSGSLVAFNELKITFTDPSQDYQETEAPGWIDFDDQAVRGQERADFDADMCPSSSQAQRLAKIHMAKSNPRWRGTIRTDLRGLEAVGERIIRAQIAELRIDTTFRVTGWGVSADLSGCSFALSALGPGAYAWDPETDEGEQTPPLPDDDEDAAIPVPVFASYVYSGGDLVVTYTADRSDLTLDAQISVDGLWRRMDDDDNTAVYAAAAAHTYDVRARWITAGNAAGGWSAPETITL